MAWHLKNGYRENAHPPGLRRDANAGQTFWNAARIASSRHYQYDVYLLAKALARANGFSHLLDVGSGPGTKASMLFQGVVESITLVDQPEVAPLAEIHAPGAQFIGADLEQVTSGIDREFDLVICADVLEHLEDPSSCLRFIHQHLANNGIAVISTVERDFLHGAECAECLKAEHVREWNSAEFAALLAEFGFSVVQQFTAPQIRPSNLQENEGVLLAYPLSNGAVAVPPDENHACQISICRT